MKNIATGLALLAPIPASVLAALSAGTAGVMVAILSVALAIVAVTLLQRRPAPAPPPPPPAPRDPGPEIDATLKRIRHDLRGALSPALLTTDRLLSSPDAATQRSGTVISQSIERAITLIGEIRPDGPERR